MSVQPLEQEDEARANFYALLAQLFYAPPEPDFLTSLARAEAVVDDGGGSPLASAWRDLAHSAAGATAQAVREEYESVFVGTGRAEVTLYTGAYTLNSALDNPLVQIRDFLSAQGLQRKQSVHEPEDHIAALCEVMRHLVVRGDVAMQRDFFEGFVWPASGPLCAAILEHPRVTFYGDAAKFAKRFFELEHDAFQMD